MSERFDDLTRAQLVQRIERLESELASVRALHHEHVAVHEQVQVQFEQLTDLHAKYIRAAERFHELFHLAPVGYLIVDRIGVIQDANLAATEIVGAPRKAVVGKPLRLFFTAPDQPRLDDHFRRCRAERAKTRTELRLLSRSGFERPVEVLSEAAQFLERGGPIFRTAIIDLSDRRHLEQALRESNEVLQLAHSAAGFGVWRWDLKTDELHWSDTLFALMELAPGATEPTWDRWLAWILPEDRQQFVKAMERLKSGDEEVQFEFRTALVSDRQRWFLFRGKTLHAPGDAKRHAAGVVSDISNLKRIEQRLASTNQELQLRRAEAEDRGREMRRLAVQLTYAEQRERQRLAKVLHDHLQQWLIAAKIHTGILKAGLSEEADKGLAGEVETQLGKCIDMARSLAVELVPPVLRDLELVSALEELAVQARMQHRLQVQVQGDQSTIKASEAVALLVYESVRELLLNIAKHAQTDRASVHIGLCGPDRLRVVVEDRGAGFDAQAINRSLRNRSTLGLPSICRRVELLGGEVQIASSPGKGTRVTLETPLADGEASAD